VLAVFIQKEIIPSRVKQRSRAWLGHLHKNRPRARDHHVQVDDGRRPSTSEWCSGTRHRPVRGTNPWSKIRYQLLDRHPEREKRNANLEDTEVGENEASGTGRSPDEEHLDPETSRTGMLVDQVGGSVTGTKVPEPIGGSGEGHGFGTDVEREDLTGNDPSDRTPCGGEEGDVDADESNQNLLSGDVRGRDRDTNDGDQ